MKDDIKRAADRLAEAMDLIVNCDAFAEPFADHKNRDEDDEEVRQERIDMVLRSGAKALADYREAVAAAGVALPREAEQKGGA